MRIKDIMSTNVEIVSPETFLHEVAGKMRASDCGSILVGKNDRLVGVITDRDLVLRCVAESYHPEETTAGQVMTEQVLYCRETDTLEETVLNMAKNKVRRLPVLDQNKRLVGIVSLGDLAAHSIGENHRLCGKVLGHICVAPEPSMAARNAEVSYA